jgi:uncharacterized RDD family membrane protein YckC
VTERGISPLPREARPYQGKRAGVVTRVAAAAIDSILAGAALGLAYLGLAGLLFVLDPRNFRFPDTSLLLSVASWLVILAVYLTIAWWAGGRTYGNLVMGLRVVAYTGRKLGFTGALLRAVLYVIFPVGLLWCAVSRENRSVQDVVLRTSVVYDWQARAVSGAR